MKYFIVEGILVDPCPADKETFETSLREHLVHLDKAFEDGSILVTGPKAAGGGGFFLMKAESPAAVNSFLDKDPMKLAGVQDYIVNEFTVHKNHPQACRWFE
jgi:uncharacterized protein YciI